MVGSRFGCLRGTLYPMDLEFHVDRLILLASAIHISKGTPAWCRSYDFCPGSHLLRDQGSGHPDLGGGGGVSSGLFGSTVSQVG
jgi:hypothetical protein